MLRVVEKLIILGSIASRAGAVKPRVLIRNAEGEDVF
jgi:hypothetical protein